MIFLIYLFFLLLIVFFYCDFTFFSSLLRMTAGRIGKKRNIATVIYQRMQMPFNWSQFQAIQFNSMGWVEAVNYAAALMQHNVANKY